VAELGWLVYQTMLVDASSRTSTYLSPVNVSLCEVSDMDLARHVASKQQAHRAIVVSSM
jgi:hypothetical protein